MNKTRDYFWNTLTLAVVLLAAGIGYWIYSVYNDPYIPFNPFPPPTLPSTSVVPSATPSPLPPLTVSPTATVTITSSVQASPIPSQTFTPSPTQTPSVTPTPLPTGHLTLTSLAQLNPGDKRTAQAVTQEVSQIYQAQTQVALALYGPNPSFAAADNGAVSGQWSKQVPEYFTWVKTRADMVGYYYYWGPYYAGTNKKAVYDDNVVINFDIKNEKIKEGSVYYLRIRTIYAGGIENPDWATIFVFKFDKTPPTEPNLIDADRAADGVWRKYVYAPVFVWANSSDNASGVSHYNVYWGPDSMSTTPTLSQTGTVFSQPLKSGNFYLKVQSVDGVDNTSNWVILFNLLVDNEPPAVPDIQTVTLFPPLPNKAYTQDVPIMEWLAPQESGSGISFYRLYWGTDTVNQSPNYTVSSPRFIPPPMETSAGTQRNYHLRIQAVDNMGNASAWSDQYDIVFDRK